MQADLTLSCIGSYIVCGKIENGPDNPYDKSIAFYAMLSSTFDLYEIRILRSSVYQNDNTKFARCYVSTGTTLRIMATIVTDNIVGILYTTPANSTSLTYYSTYSYYMNLTGHSLLSYYSPTASVLRYIYTSFDSGTERRVGMICGVNTASGAYKQLYIDGYDTYHSKSHFTYSTEVWSAYIHKSQTNSCKKLILFISL